MSEAATDDVENQRAFKAWGSKLSRSSVTLAPEVSAEVLAEEFGELDEDRRDQMCSSAVMIAFDDGHNEVHLKHFEEAYEETELEVDQEDGSDDVQEDTPEPDPEADTEPTDDGGPEIFDEDNDDVPRETDQSESSEQSTDGSDGDDNISEMSRSELEQEVQSLRSEVDKLQEVANRDMALVKGALTNMMDVESLEELPGAGDHFNEQFAEREERLNSVESDVDGIDSTLASGQGGKSSKVRNIVQLANNRRKDESVIVLDVSDIKDATGVSRRYAYDLVEDLPEEYPWLHDRGDLAQYGDLEIDKDKQKTAIAVDFDGVHDKPCPVNKFTTGGS